MWVYRRGTPFAGQPSQRLAVLPIVSMDYRLAINAPDDIRIETTRDADIALYDLVEIEREGERETVGIVTGIERSDTRLALRAEGLLSVLSWRVVAWRAGITDRSRFFNRRTEGIIKLIATWNLGASATTANGRLLDGAVAWLEIEPNQARGPILPSRGCAWRNVLDECVELAEIGDADLRVSLTDGGLLRLSYHPRPTALVVAHRFAPSLGNVERWAVRETAHTASAVIAAGQGEEDAREVSTATSTDMPAREAVRHATWDSADLAREAERELLERRADISIEWRAAQTAGSRYWRDYRLGDYVQVQAGGYTETHRIVSVSAHIEGAQEHIDIETREVA